MSLLLGLSPRSLFSSPMPLSFWPSSSPMPRPLPLLPLLCLSPYVLFHLCPSSLLLALSSYALSLVLLLSYALPLSLCPLSLSLPMPSLSLSLSSGPSRRLCPLPQSSSVSPAANVVGFPCVSSLFFVNAPTFAAASVTAFKKDDFPALGFPTHASVTSAGIFSTSADFQCPASRPLQKLEKTRCGRVARLDRRWIAVGKTAACTENGAAEAGGEGTRGSARLRGIERAARRWMRARASPLEHLHRRGRRTIQPIPCWQSLRSESSSRRCSQRRFGSRGDQPNPRDSGASIEPRGPWIPVVLKIAVGDAGGGARG